MPYFTVHSSPSSFHVQRNCHNKLSTQVVNHNANTTHTGDSRQSDIYSGILYLVIVADYGTAVSIGPVFVNHHVSSFTAALVPVSGRRARRAQ